MELAHLALLQVERGQALLNSGIVLSGASARPSDQTIEPVFKRLTQLNKQAANIAENGGPLLGAISLRCLSMGLQILQQVIQGIGCLMESRDK